MISDMDNINTRQANKRRNRRGIGEAGFTSIVITLIIMLVLTVLTVGFAQLMRREQRQALDRQLSLQAFYAAEAGVSEARYAIQHSGYNKDKKQCDDGTENNFDTYIHPSAANGGFENPNLDTAYTCLLIDQQPPTLQYNLSVDKAVVFPIHSDTAFDQVSFRWNGANGKNAIKSATPPLTLPPLNGINGWGAGSTGMLRVDITRIPNGSAVTTFDRNTLQDQTMTLYLYPSSNGSSAAIPFNSSPTGATGTGNIFNVDCDTGSKVCSTNINGLAGANLVYIRVRAVYNPVSLTVAPKTAAGGAVTVSGVQAVIDSTGRTSDVLRRIQVRVPLVSQCATDFSNTCPTFAIQSATDICKLYTFDGTNVKDDGCVNPAIPPPPTSDINPGIGGIGCEKPNPKDCAPQDLTWTRRLKNTTDTQGNRVISCTWHINDGVTPDKHTGCDPAPTGTGIPCLPSYCVTYSFKPWTPVVCKKFVVTLTVVWAGGSKDTTFKINEPGGVKSPC